MSQHSENLLRFDFQAGLLEPIQIDPNGIYRDGQLRLLLGFSEATMKSARKDGTLRFAKRGRQLYYHGQDVLDWLLSREADGEVPVGE